MDRIRTAGHGALSAEELARLLREAGIDLVVDVRRYPGSRRHPQFAAEAMGAWLPGAGIEYLWLPELGGRRKVVPGSPHHALRNEQFRAYADHMASDEFATGLERLREAASDRSAAVLCSESVWWRCHRRLLADRLVLVDGVAVEHLFHDGRLQPHPPTPEARVEDGNVLYDAGVRELSLPDDG